MGSTKFLSVLQYHMQYEYYIQKALAILSRGSALILEMQMAVNFKDFFSFLYMLVPLPVYHTINTFVPTYLQLL